MTYDDTKSARRTLRTQSALIYRFSYIPGISTWYLVVPDLLLIIFCCFWLCIALGVGSGVRSLTTTTSARRPQTPNFT
jgi:hypothetical protein